MSNSLKAGNALCKSTPHVFQRSILAVLLMTGGFAQAATVYTDGDKSLNIGMGMLTSINNGTGNKMNLDDFRLYTSGKVSKSIGFTFNMARDTQAGSDQLRVMDAIAQIEVAPEVNLWAGQFLPAFDRQGLNGPYYSSASPSVYGTGFQGNYPAKFKGRDVGIAVWGDIENFKYQLGVFNGTPKTPLTSPNQTGSQLYSARVSYALLEAEPGYYTSGTYYGAKDIATIAMYWQHQKNGYGTAALPSNYTGTGVDFLFEKKIAQDGAATLEGGYTKFDLGNNPVVPTTYGALYYLAPFQGKSWFIQPAYYTGYKVGAGILQPYVKYTSNTPDTGFGVKNTQTDIGVGYLIKGYDTRVFLNYSKPSLTRSVTSASLQLQF